MQPKQYFQSIQDKIKELQRLREQVWRQRMYADSVGAGGMGSACRMQSGSSRVENAAIQLIDASELYYKRYKEYMPEINRARRVIAKVEQARYRKLLTMRHLQGRGWKEISAALGYTNKNSVHQAHGWALRHAGEILTSMSQDGKM